MREPKRSRGRDEAVIRDRCPRCGKWLNPKRFLDRRLPGNPNPPDYHREDSHEL